MKKALAGPAKRTAKKKPERRAMIAAARVRTRAALAVAVRSLRTSVTRSARSARFAARRTNQILAQARPRIGRVAKRGLALAIRASRWAGRRLRPIAVRVFRGLAIGERWLRRAGGVTGRVAKRATAAVTPGRASCALILTSAAVLVVSQFVEYRAVEVGRPGYAGLVAAKPPTVGAETAGRAHSYLLVAPALLAAALAAIVLRRGRRRLGRPVFALGLLSLAVILSVDLPAGLDAGVQASRFSGAHAILELGFYAELAAAAGLMLGGLLLYYARPCPIRISSSARDASGPRRRRRRRASRPGRAARRASRRRSDAASAPASRP
jgi:hypothetical protein